MRTYLVYRVVNGVPRRVLSLSNRVTGGADTRGYKAAGDMPGPKEFFQGSSFLSEAERPQPFPMTEKVNHCSIFCLKNDDSHDLISPI